VSVNCKNTALQTVNEEMPPRISLMARISKDGFPIREIPEIRGEKPSRKRLMLMD
jgi:hypothetical protein